MVDDTALPGNWTQVELPRVIDKPAALPGAGKPPVTTTWLRIRLDELQGTKGPTHFYLLRWLAAGQIAVYADGRLLYRSTGSPVWNLFNHPALLLPLNLTADNPPPRTLLIRLDSLPSPEAGISSFYAGDSDSLVEMAGRRDWLANQLPFMCSAAFLAVGLFSLAVWVVRRQSASLYLFTIAVLGATRRWHFQLGPEKLIVSDAWFIWLTLNALMWQSLITHYFMPSGSAGWAQKKLASLGRQRQPSDSHISICLAFHSRKVLRLAASQSCAPWPDQACNMASPCAPTGQEGQSRSNAMAASVWSTGAIA